MARLLVASSPSERFFQSPQLRASVHSPRAGSVSSRGSRTSRASGRSSVNQRAVWSTSALVLTLPTHAPWAEELCGVYDPQRTTVRGMPWWTKRRGPGFLFSDPRGAWVFALQKAHMDKGLGWVCSATRHCGGPPLSMTWKVSASPGARWQLFPDAAVKLEPTGRRAASRATSRMRGSRTSRMSRSRSSVRSAADGSEDGSEEEDEEGGPAESAAETGLRAALALRADGPPLAAPAAVSTPEDTQEYLLSFRSLEAHMQAKERKLARTVLAAKGTGADGPPPPPHAGPPIQAVRVHGAAGMQTSCSAADDAKASLKKSHHWYRADYPTPAEDTEVAEWFEALPQAWHRRLADDPDPVLAEDVLCAGCVHTRRNPASERAAACCGLMAVLSVWRRVLGSLNKAAETGWLNAVREWFGGGGAEELEEQDEWQAALLEIPPEDAAEGTAAVCIYTAEARSADGTPRPTQLAARVQAAMQQIGDPTRRGRSKDVERYAHLAALELLRPLIWRLDRFIITLQTLGHVADVQVSWRSAGHLLSAAQCRPGRVAHWASLTSLTHTAQPQWFGTADPTETCVTHIAVDLPGAAVVDFCTLQEEGELMVHSHMLVDVASRLPRHFLLALCTAADVVVVEQYLPSAPELLPEERAELRLRALRMSSAVFHSFEQCAAPQLVSSTRVAGERELLDDVVAAWLSSGDDGVPLVLVGDEGSGKTTALVSIALATVAAAADGDADDESTPLPVFVHLPAFDVMRPDAVATALVAQLGLSTDAEAADALRHRPLVVLVDGVAECPSLCSMLASLESTAQSRPAGHPASRRSTRRRTTQRRRTTRARTRASGWKVDSDEELRKPLLSLSGMERWPNAKVAIACGADMLASEFDPGPAVGRVVSRSGTKVYYLQHLDQTGVSDILRRRAAVALDESAELAEWHAMHGHGTVEEAAADIAARGIPSPFALSIAQSARNAVGPRTSAARLRAAATSDDDMKRLPMLWGTWVLPAVDDAAEAMSAALAQTRGISHRPDTLVAAIQAFDDLPRAADSLGLLPPVGIADVCEATMIRSVRRAMQKRPEPSGWGVDQFLAAAGGLAAALPLCFTPSAALKAVREQQKLSEAEGVAVVEAMPLRTPPDWNTNAPNQFRSVLLHEQLRARHLWFNTDAALAGQHHPMEPERRRVVRLLGTMLRRAPLEERASRVRLLLDTVLESRGLGMHSTSDGSDRRRFAAAHSLSVIAAAGLPLDGADLSGISAPGALLGGAAVRGANLRKSDLTFSHVGCDLRWSDLSLADFRGARTGGLPLVPVAATGAVSLTPDGSKAVAAGADGRVYLLDASTCGLAREPMGSSELRANTLTSFTEVGGGRYVAGAAGDALAIFPILPGGGVGTAQLITDGLRGRVTCVGDGGSWLVSGGQGFAAVHKLPSTAPVCCVECPCEVTAVVGVGDVVVCGGVDGSLHASSVPDGGRLWSADLHRAVVTAVAAAPSLAAVVSGGADGRVLLVSADTGAAVRTVSAARSPVTCINVLRCGRRVAVGTSSGTVAVSCLKSGTALSTSAGLHACAVVSVSVSSDSRRAVTAGADGQVRFSALAHPGHPDPALDDDEPDEQSPSAPWDLPFAASGYAAARSARRGFRVFDVRTGFWTQLTRAGRVFCLALSDDARFVFSGGAEKSILRHDLRSPGAAPALVATLPHQPYALCCDGGNVYSGAADHRVRCHGVHRAGLLWETGDDHHAAVNAVKARDGVLVSGGASGSVLLHDCGTGAVIRSVCLHVGPVRAVDVVGGVVASGGEDGAVRVHRASTGEQLLRASRGDWVLGVAISGGVVASSGTSGAVRAHDITTGAGWGVNGDAVGGLAPTPDGQHVVCAGLGGRLRTFGLPDDVAAADGWAACLLPAVMPARFRPLCSAEGAQCAGTSFGGVLARTLEEAGAVVTQDQKDAAEASDGE